MWTLDSARTLARAGRLLARRRLRRGPRLGAPLVMSFLVTNRCVLRCRHCFYHETLDRPGGRELSLEEYERLSGGLDDLLVGLFCGGEPFVRPDLAELVRLLRRNSGLLVAGIATNGQLASSVLGQVEAICRDDPSRPLALSVSLDGFEEVHDEIRGRGTFDRAVRTYLECRRLARHHPNLVLGLTTVVSTLNQRLAPAFLRWAGAELGPAALTVLLARQSPAAGRHITLVEPEAYLRAVAAARRPGPARPVLDAVGAAVHRTMTTGGRSFRCHAGRRGGFVDFDGEVNVCEVLAERPASLRLGNLRDHDMDFLAIWNGEAAARVRGLVNRHEACRACTHETMGYLPSIAFGANPARLLGARACRRPTGARPGSRPGGRTTGRAHGRADARAGMPGAFEACAR